MSRAGTHATPRAPTTALVTSGPFRFSRNPIYVAYALFTAAILLVVALAFEERILPASGQGVVMLLCLALLSHAGGQGLLTYALGHLPAAFSSIVILIEGVAAAVFGWLILDERLTLLQFIGCFAIFAGIYIARPRRAKASPQSAANITQ